MERERGGIPPWYSIAENNEQIITLRPNTFSQNTAWRGVNKRLLTLTIYIKGLKLR